MSEEIKEINHITLTSDKLKQYFRKSFIPRQMEQQSSSCWSSGSKKRTRGRAMVQERRLWEHRSDVALKWNQRTSLLNMINVILQKREIP